MIAISPEMDTFMLINLFYDLFFACKLMNLADALLTAKTRLTIVPKIKK